MKVPAGENKDTRALPVPAGTVRTTSDGGRPDASDRDRTAEDRDRISETHDLTARDRDRHAAERDARATLRDEKAGSIDLDAAADRSGARRDRQGAAGDRRSASADRHAAWTDRALSASERAAQLVDELTGSLRRQAGLAVLEREVCRASRMNEHFVLAFIDIDHLKAMNDLHGHDAGDQLLRAVVTSLRGVIREYDVIVRYGGDEFLCGLMDVGLDEARERFRRAGAHLAERFQASMSVGLAQFEPGEGLGDLITRADAAMYQTRHPRAADAPPGAAPLGAAPE